ncbi:MAG: hypothetical protein ACKPKO_19085, partial [Candidatus Fonsibacter sp.]
MGVLDGADTSYCDHDEFWAVDQDEIAVATHAHDRLGSAFVGRPIYVAFPYMKDRDKARGSNKKGAKGGGMITETGCQTELEQVAARAMRLLSMYTAEALVLSVTRVLGKDASDNCRHMWDQHSASLRRYIEDVGAGHVAACKAVPL